MKVEDRTKGNPDFTKDPYWGKGGRYIVNPVTGQREPAPPEVEEAAAADSAPGPAAAQTPAPAKDAAEADPKNTLKEKRRG